MKANLNASFCLLVRSVSARWISPCSINSSASNKRAAWASSSSSKLNPFSVPAYKEISSEEI
jgi:hypothetical protein